MRQFVAIASVCLLGACTAAQEQQACQLDQALQPGVASAVGATGPTGAQAAEIDNSVVHPLVQTGCAALVPSVP